MHIQPKTFHKSCVFPEDHWCVLWTLVKHSMIKEIYRSTIMEWLLKFSTFSNNIGYLIFQTQRDGKCGKKKRNEKKLQYRVAVNSEKGTSRKSIIKRPCGEQMRRTLHINPHPQTCLHTHMHNTCKVVNTKSKIGKKIKFKKNTILKPLWISGQTSFITLWNACH